MYLPQQNKNLIQKKGGGADLINCTKEYNKR